MIVPLDIPLRFLVGSVLVTTMPGADMALITRQVLVAGRRRRRTTITVRATIALPRDNLRCRTGIGLGAPPGTLDQAVGLEPGALERPRHLGLALVLPPLTLLQRGSLVRERLPHLGAGEPALTSSRWRSTSAGCSRAAPW